MQKILLSPHNDDAVLFAAFALCANPDMKVVTVYDSFVQPANPRLTDDENLCVGATQRRREDKSALRWLGIKEQLCFAGLRDDTDYSSFEIRQAVDIAAGKPNWSDVELWIPMHHEGGHDQHNAVAEAFGNAQLTHRYASYIRQTGRVREGAEVRPQPEWIRAKLLAMAEYRSQIEIEALGCWPWFMDLKEYIA